MKLIVAKIGKSVGLRGDLKLHLDTDFPEQFKKGVTFNTDIGPLEIENYSRNKGTVKFKNYNSREDTKRLTNVVLYSDEEQTKENVELDDGEFFWFDIIGLEVYEEDTLIGSVDSIERYTDIDYLKIVLEKSLAEAKKQKRLLLPYNDNYIIDTNIDAKKITAKNITPLLDA